MRDAESAEQSSERDLQSDVDIRGIVSDQLPMVWKSTTRGGRSRREKKIKWKSGRTLGQARNRGGGRLAGWLASSSNGGYLKRIDSTNIFSQSQ